MSLPKKHPWIACGFLCRGTAARVSYARARTSPPVAVVAMATPGEAAGMSVGDMPSVVPARSPRTARACSGVVQRRATLEVALSRMAGDRVSGRLLRGEHDREPRRAALADEGGDEGGGLVVSVAGEGSEEVGCLVYLAAGINHPDALVASGAARAPVL